MNLSKWMITILMLGLIVALTYLNAHADPYPYRHPHGNAYGWDGPGHHKGHYKHFRRNYQGPQQCLNRVYVQPAPVVYVAPAAPVVAIPYAAPRPYVSQSVTPGLSGQLQFNF
jgi:hypothetical protein